MQITVTLPRPDHHYAIVFGPLSALPAHLNTVGLQRGKCLLVTDENVYPLYGQVLEPALTEAGWTVRVHVVPAREQSKSAAVLEEIYQTALEWGIDRDTPVLALGGGVVGDLAGFAAATLLRGLPLVQIPTTLMAQADSSIGGKTGINHPTGKNLIGAFHQPALVWMAPATLNTLPDREWTSGLAEVIKYGCIADAPFLDLLDAQWADVTARTPDVVAQMVYRAAQQKVRIVEADEREAGRRALLNFGHTFAHAIEHEAGYGVCTHGEAVAQGMLAALHLSRMKHPGLDIQQPVALINRLPAPGILAHLDPEALYAAMATDKKRRGDRLRFILLDRIGHGYVEDALGKEEVIRAIELARVKRLAPNPGPTNP